MEGVVLHHRIVWGDLPAEAAWAVAGRLEGVVLHRRIVWGDLPGEAAGEVAGRSEGVVPRRRAVWGGPPAGADHRAKDSPASVFRRAEAEDEC
ncbi:MAG: hypothetical protein LBQ90_02170, partial [Synergistaceae bacterium]|nr:hypothetical protein [Synergistaceae bacterium]